MLGQFIVYYLDHDHLLWISILSACGLWRVILLSLSLLFVAGKQKSSVLKLLKILTVTVLIVVAAEYTLIGYYGLGALNTTDTLAGVALLTATGSVLKYSALLLMIILITGWIIVIYLYFGVIRKETSGC
ncbi:hypothetical protein SDC9_89488 [bioreactor metagenome]|uniref:Uncharacterized protein n=1 Tax=bioreactor metagenome TaxID=1076179 RepID=A0A644ZPZ1_9ZZZZ